MKLKVKDDFSTAYIPYAEYLVDGVEKQYFHPHAVHAGQVFEVPDAIGYKILSSHGQAVEEYKPKKEKAPKPDGVVRKEVDSEDLTKF